MAATIPASECGKFASSNAEPAALRQSRIPIPTARTPTGDSETVGNCILKFSINDDGSLGKRSNFALLNLLVKNKVESWWLGPDSMKIDGKGNIYVAQWTGGKVLKLSPEGKLLHVFEITAGEGTTNVAFGEGGKDLYVTVVKDPNDPKAKGSVVKIPNVD
jgi:sugar lactone lactonase YvrE